MVVSVNDVNSIVGYYLYGRTYFPDDLTSDALIRGSNPTELQVSSDEYFTVGPGRFAKAAMSSLVDQFFRPEAWDLNGQTLPILSPGEYTKNQLKDIFGNNSFGISFQQYNYIDENDDLAIRTFLWNSTAIQLTDNSDMKFVVEPDGTRYIKNMSLDIRGVENFDFVSGNWLANITANYVQDRMDVSGIGRRVDFEFIGDAPVTARYGIDEFEEDRLSIDQNYAPLSDPASLLLGVDDLLDQFWRDGVSRFLDENNRPIIYGTNEADALSVDMSDVTEARPDPVTDNPYFTQYLENGIAIVAGAGNDTLVGTQKGDFISGGQGNDVVDAGDPDAVTGEPPVTNAADQIFAGEGNDIVTIGGGKDVVSLGAGDDFINISTPIDKEHFPTAAVIWGGEGADIYNFTSEAHVLILDVGPISDETLKNLVIEKLFSAINPVQAEYPYTHVLLNVDSSDRFWFDGQELGSASLHEETQTGGFQEWLWTLDDWQPGDTYFYWDATGQRTTTETWTNRKFVMNEDESVEVGVGEGDFGNVVSYFSTTDTEFTITIEGFKNELGGININGNGLDYESHKTITDQQIDVQTFREEIDLIFINRVPIAYTPIGDPIVMYEDLLGSNLKHDGFDSTDIPTFDLTGFLVTTEQGGDGDDGFEGKALPQRLRGGAGSDTVDYSGSPLAVVVDLGSGKGYGGTAEGDIYISIENVIGSTFDDIIISNEAENSISGRGGDDILVLVGDGSDAVDGGEGEDIAVFWYDASEYSWSVSIGGNLIASHSSTGYAVTLRDVEIFSFDDVDVSMEDIVNAISLGGTSGDDTIAGTSNNDLIHGGLGNDTLQGGAGSDTYRYNVGDGADSIDDWADQTATDVLELAAGISPSSVAIGRGTANIWDIVLDFGNGDTVTIKGGFFAGSSVVEQVRFADNTVWEVGDLRQIHLDQKATAGNDTIEGFIDVNDLIHGGDGNDTIYAFTGNDTIYGDAGDDTIFGDEGDDTIIGGAGSDFMIGGTGSDVFVLNTGDGEDWINDFEVGVDKIDLSAISSITSFSDLTANAAEWVAGSTWLYTDANNYVRLEGVSLSSLQANDFVFA